MGDGNVRQFGVPLATSHNAFANPGARPARTHASWPPRLWPPTMRGTPGNACATAASLAGKSVINNSRYPQSAVRDARALLLPSFAEGYGMPVAEALSVGTPVICSDLPALREAGGDAPDFLDPLDGPGWRAAILDHHQGGAMRAAQLRRVPTWRSPTWEDHIEIVCNAIEALRR